MIDPTELTAARQVPFRALDMAERGEPALTVEVDPYPTPPEWVRLDCYFAVLRWATGVAPTCRHARYRHDTQLVGPFHIEPAIGPRVTCGNCRVCPGAAQCGSCGQPGARRAVLAVAQLRVTVWACSDCWTGGGA